MPSLARHARGFIAVVAALSIALPGTTLPFERAAQAQGKKKPIREQLPKDAQAHWDNAVAFFKKGAWEDARASFQAAYDASKNPRVLFNVAVCERSLKRYGKAMETYEQELAEGKGALTAEEEREVKEQIAGIERLTAPLTVEVNEAGADVYVDDQKIGTAPIPAAVLVPFGERRVKATKSEFLDAVETVELKSGQPRRVSLKLVPQRKMARVRVAVTGPRAADVFIDNTRVGSTDDKGVYEGEVAVRAEPHELRIEAPGFTPARESRVVREGETTTLSIAMAEEAKKGKLVVVTVPDGGIISVDGQVKGSSRFEGPVDAGPHAITVKKQGYYQWSLDVDVPKNAERNVTASLNEDRNTSFVPWLIGSILVVGASSAAVYFVTKPKDEEKVNGTLPPFTVNTQQVRWR